MNNQMLLKIAAFGAAASMGLPANANEQAGVSCPSGFTATITDGNKALKCSKVKTFTLASICSPVAFGDKLTSIQLNTNITMDPVGREGGIDQCLATVSGTRVDSVKSPPLEVGSPPASEFVRIKRATAVDSFQATVTEFAHPVNPGGVLLVPYVGNPATGVHCPSGFDGDAVFSGKGIRCDKLSGSAKNADCDFGTQYVRDADGGTEDRCFGLQKGPTKPQGITFVQQQLENALPTVSWKLTKRAGQDTWQKKEYAFPVR